MKHNHSIFHSPSVLISPQSKTANHKSEIINEEIFFSRNYPQTPRLLGLARMSHHTALLHSGRRRDDEPLIEKLRLGNLTTVFVMFLESTIDKGKSDWATS